MDRILVGVLCLSGCLTFSTCLLHQYHFVSEAKTWTEAQSYCRETYTDLAIVENTEEMEKLKDTVSTAGDISQVWIGLYSHVDWKWSDGFNQSGAEYWNWAHDEPNNDGGNQFCVGMNNEGEWSDYFCHEQLPFVCYRVAGGFEFVPVNTAKTWSEAQKHCRDDFTTDLATVRNDTDNEEINDLKPLGPWAWIGLYRDPQIYWSDGSNFSFSSWVQDVNPLGSMEVVCGVADLNNGGKWRLFSCEERKPFVCYSVPTVKTLLTVKVKIQGSSVELNDQKEQILKQLQDRLKANGLSGVTLRWKVQADGNVFHKEEKGSDKKKKTEL